MELMQKLLEKSAERHKHLCPRQVLGVRMGLLAKALLDFKLPQHKKRLITIIETDGCFSDGIEVTTGCSVGHRTLRVEDYGKVAAVFVDTKDLISFRVAPALNVRSMADTYGVGRSKWERQLTGYQKIPIFEMFTVNWVELNLPISEIVSRPGVRTNCDDCGEEIINERELNFENTSLCKSCAGNGYYQIKRHSFKKLGQPLSKELIESIEYSIVN